MRRHASSLLALLLVLPLAYASAAPAPQRGGTLTYALRDEPDRLDPNLSGLRPSQIVFFQIFDPLIVRDKKDKKFKPWLPPRPGGASRVEGGNPQPAGRDREREQPNSTH